jgi:hypothetical protein
MSLLTLLQVVFITLKITDQIDWSWWIVLLPFIVRFVINFVIIALEELS